MPTRFFPASSLAYTVTRWHSSLGGWDVQPLSADDLGADLLSSGALDWLVEGETNGLDLDSFVRSLRANEGTL